MESGVRSLRSDSGGERSAAQFNSCSKPDLKARLAPSYTLIASSTAAGSSAVGRVVSEFQSTVSTRTRWILAFAGGVVMAYGARLARGCTSGQALSGGAVLSVGSWAFMFSVFGGAYALAYFVRRLWN